MTAADERVTGYVALIRARPALRHLWLGKVISFCGDWFNTIALYVAIEGLSSSARAIALVMVVKTLPVFAVTPIAGPLIDRFDRRRLLLATDLFRGVCALGLVVAHQLGSLVGLYGCTVLMMCGTGLAVPTKNAVLPRIVERELVPIANALLGGTWSVMLAVGAALGGAAVALIGVQAALVVDAATYAVAAALFARLPPLPPPGHGDDGDGPDTAPASEGDVTPALAHAGFVAGLRYLVRAPYILALSLLKTMMQLYGALTALLPLFGTRVFPDASGPMYVGLLFAARGVGAAIGALGLRAWLGDDARIMRRVIWAGYLVGGAAAASLALATAYWHAALAYGVLSLCHSAIWVNSGTLLQLEADPRYHGRVFAVEFGVMMLVLASSSYGAGAALDAGMSLDAVVLAWSAMAVIPLAVWTGVLVARRKRG